MIKETQKQALLSYARSFLVAALAVYSTGDVSLKNMLYAGLAAVIAPAIRALNPNDPAFGKVSEYWAKTLPEWIDDMVEAEIEARSKKKKKTTKKK